MLSWLAHRLIARNMDRLNGGDVAPTLRLDADDVRFRFPGTSSWGGEMRGKADLRRWLERMVAIGLHHDVDQVVLSGMPWRQTICLRGRDHLDDATDGRVYENRYVIWGTLRWGRLTEYEVYEDTERALALDAWLERRELSAA
jgi:ketosteroid isomerase-like protein